MSKQDDFENKEPLADDAQAAVSSFDYKALSDLLSDAPDIPFEDSGVSDYVPPKNGFVLPELDEASDFSAVEQGAAPPPASGGTEVFRSNDGTSEFCSFDDLSPDSVPDGWHQEEAPIISDVIKAQETPSVDSASDETEHDEYEAPEDRDDVDGDDDDDDDDEPAGHPFLHALGHIFLGFITFISILYLVAVYSDNSFITKARNTYIQTAMATLNHKWLATAIIPPDTIRDLMRLNYESESILRGKESNWGDVDVQALPMFENATTELTGTLPEEAASEGSTFMVETDAMLEELYGSAEEQTFFELFYEIDYRSMQSYVDDHPEVVADGWDKIYINEAGLDDEGTEIKTIYGDQVLAIDAQEGVVLIRLNINLSRGVMAICKDSSRLRLCAASTLGSIGQTAGRICDTNDGVLAVTANGFVDIDGGGNGGEISGIAVCGGVQYGSSLGGGYKRAEFRNDNHMYIVDSSTPVSADTRDAAEFTPALIIDGDVVVDETTFWNAPNPRTCIGQTNYLETVLVVMEGRYADSPGCSVVPVAEKMHQYGCVQAMNMDGGTSAIMYYDGQYVTRCSNQNLSAGRTLPNAWVYG